MSMQTSTHVTEGGYFEPVIRLYDGDFHATRVYSGFTCNEHHEGPAGPLPLDKSTRYVVFHTGEQQLQHTTLFHWNGDWAGSTLTGTPVSGFAPVPGMAPAPVRTLFRPHLRGRLHGEHAILINSLKPCFPGARVPRRRSIHARGPEQLDSRQAAAPLHSTAPLSLSSAWTASAIRR